MLIDVKIVCCNDERAAAGHRVARVHANIEQHLVQLRRIAFDRPQILWITAAHLDRFWKSLPRDVDHFLDEIARLDQDALALDTAREGEHLLYDARAASREGEQPLSRGFVVDRRRSDATA